VSQQQRDTWGQPNFKNETRSRNFVLVCFSAEYLGEKFPEYFSKPEQLSSDTNIVSFSFDSRCAPLFSLGDTKQVTLAARELGFEDILIVIPNSRPLTSEEGLIAFMIYSFVFAVCLFLMRRRSRNNCSTNTNNIAATPIEFFFDDPPNTRDAQISNPMTRYDTGSLLSCDTPRSLERFRNPLTKKQEASADEFPGRSRYRPSSVLLFIAFLVTRIPEFKAFASSHKPAFFLACAVLFVVIIKLFQRETALTRDAKIVLWIRRFHRKDLRRFPFQLFLETSCASVACPITIQDSTYKRSLGDLASRGPIVLAIQFMLIIVATFIASDLLRRLLLLIAGVIGFDNQPNEFWAVFHFITWLLLIWFCIRHFGFIALSENNYSKKVQKIIERIKSGRGTSALQILKCEDSFWQKVVLQILPVTDTIVIDVTDITSNIEWELMQVKQHIRPEKVVLICASQSGHLVCDEQHLMKVLLTVFGREWLVKCFRTSYELPSGIWHSLSVMCGMYTVYKWLLIKRALPACRCLRAAMNSKMIDAGNGRNR
jgi:hypothetical protein